MQKISKIYLFELFERIFFSLCYWTVDDCSIYNMDKRESRDESFRLNLKTRHVTRFFAEKLEPESSSDTWSYTVPRHVEGCPM